MFGLEDFDSNISFRSVLGEMESEREEDFGVVGGFVELYLFELVILVGYEELEEEVDKDGLIFAMLEVRFDN